MHHAFAIEALAEEGIALALGWARRELPSFAKGYGGHSGITAHPDVVVLRYGLLGVEEARGLMDIAIQAPLAGEHKVIIITAERAYREAQNALLKLFEEPPTGTYLFLVLPTLGGLLPTLHSRVHILKGKNTTIYSSNFPLSEIAQEFIKATRERRSAIIKKLTIGKDEDERREHRDEALAIVNGIEQAAYKTGVEGHQELLAELATLRNYLHERSAPVRMILEHLAIVTPRLGSGQAPRGLI